MSGRFSDPRLLWTSSHVIGLCMVDGVIGVVLGEYEEATAITPVELTLLPDANPGEVVRIVEERLLWNSPVIYGYRVTWKVGS